MRAADSFDSAVDFLDDRLRTALLGVDSRVKESAYEIRLRAARPVVIVTRGGSLFVYKKRQNRLGLFAGCACGNSCGASGELFAHVRLFRTFKFRRRGERVYKP